MSAEHIANWTYDTPEGKLEQELRLSAGSGKLEIVKRLVERGVDFKSKDKADQRDALLWAVSGYHLDVVKYLHSKGADLNTIDRLNRNPLTSCTRPDRIELIHFLLQNGCDDSVKNVDGKTALDIHKKNYTLHEGYKQIVDTWEDMKKK